MGAELDPPLIESDKKKRERRFASVRHGLDPAQVDAFLVDIASRIEALEAELHEVRATPEVPPEGTDLVVSPSPAGDASERYAKRIARLGAVGEREVEKMLAEAKAEAATIASEASSEVDRITSDAEGGAMRSIEEARAFLTQAEGDAETTLSGVAERRRQMTEELQKMQVHLLSVAQDLGLALDPVGPDADAPGGSTDIENGAGT